MAVDSIGNLRVAVTVGSGGQVLYGNEGVPGSAFINLDTNHAIVTLDGTTGAQLAIREIPPLIGDGSFYFDRLRCIAVLPDDTTAVLGAFVNSAATNTFDGVSFVNQGSNSKDHALMRLAF